MAETWCTAAVPDPPRQLTSIIHLFLANWMMAGTSTACRDCAGIVLTLHITSEVVAWLLQGVIGQSYNRMLQGDAILNPEHALYLPDDYQFHGKETEYTVESYFTEPK